MTPETAYRSAFFLLLIALIAMRVYFMVKVRRSSGRIMPDEQAVRREGGPGVFIIRVVAFFTLIAFLVMYFSGMAWIDTFRFSLPGWLRWSGFILGLFSVIFWTWTQVHLDTQWSAQLQLRQDHHLVATGPYARLRHPLYTAMVGWIIALALLTANWIFVALAGLTTIGIILRVPKEEQMLIEAFGDEYSAYIQHAGRFFPKF